MSMNYTNGSEEDQQQSSKDDTIKRPLMYKFPTAATTQADRKFSAILNSSVFDKRLTIEKARFDSTTIPTASTSSSSTPTSSQIVAATAPLASSITLPIVPPPPSPTHNNHSVIQNILSQSTPLLIKPKQERNNVKRKKLPPLNGTATPSEIFHRNLVNAVSNVEDSDENEQYVYPYNNTTTSHADNPESMQRTTSSLYRPRSSKSLHSQHSSFFGKTNFFSDLLRPILSQRASIRQQHLYHHQQQQQELKSRPKLRSYVMDHQTQKSNSTDSPRRYSFYTDTTDDEEAAHYLLTPTLSHQKSHFDDYRKKSNCIRYMINMCLTLLLLLLVGLFCVAYTVKPLSEIKVDMGRVLSSEKELIFDLHVHVVNANPWTIHVTDADMSVFAFSQQASMNPILEGADPAEYLGRFDHFDEPLSFPSSLYNTKSVTAKSQIRIKSPGADKNGNERWSRIIRFPYGLVVRGVLKYKPLSFLTLYPESITIYNVVRIDPVTGTISNY